MRFGSVCSGIEAASVAWSPLGWQTAWVSEIEKFPCEVLKHHYPTVPNHGDMTNLKHMILNGEIEAPEVLVGGTPCQSFSCAGLRKSLEDDRGQLCVTFIHTLDSIDLVRRNRGELPAIAVWENVPGVLSTKDNAFGCFLAGLVGEECALIPAGKRWSDAGYVSGPERSAAWRILDAQYFGLAQRRRRVFVVASARDRFNPAKVLFESEGVRRDIAPSREKREEVARSFGEGAEGCFGIDEECNVTKQGSEPLLRGGQGGTRQAVGYTPSSHGDNRRAVGTLRSNGGDLGGGSETLLCMAHGQAGAEIVSDGSPSLTCNHEAPIVAFEPGIMSRCGGHIYDNISGTLRKDPGDNQMSVMATQYGNIAGSLTARHDSSPCADRGSNVVAFNTNAQVDQMNFSDETWPTLTGSQTPGVLQTMSVRRLLPVECEKLQGFPDHYTNIKPNCPDGPRYKALGNSMAVPVMRWIGTRIQKEAPK